MDVLKGARSTSIAILRCRGLIPQPVLSLKVAEARWGSSVLYSCAMQLQQDGMTPLAIPLFTAACDGAAFSLAQEAAQHTELHQPSQQVKAHDNVMHHLLTRAHRLLLCISMLVAQCCHPAATQDSR